MSPKHSRLWALRVLEEPVRTIWILVLHSSMIDPPNQGDGVLRLLGPWALLGLRSFTNHLTFNGANCGARHTKLLGNSGRPRPFRSSENTCHSSLIPPNLTWETVAKDVLKMKLSVDHHYVAIFIANLISMIDFSSPFIVR